ncbi:MAG: hypothetical protein M1813_000669 [Trichoglossum hirsutum]|nr:MAG: hypothetical protein M1813_000669 [Trichoglossum hirsutum]
MDNPTRDAENGNANGIGDIKINLIIDDTEHLSAEIPTLDDDPGITDLEVRESCWVILRFQAVQFGSWKSKPACLVIVQATFHVAVPSARFKYALVELRFEAQVNGQPNPRVGLLAPNLCFGDPTLIDHATTYRFDIFAASPGLSGPVPGLALGKSDSRSYTTQERMVVQGSTLPSRRPNRARWTIEEKATKEGILREAAFAAIVQCDDLSSGFVMKTNIKAHVSKKTFSGKDLAKILISRPSSTEGDAAVLIQKPTNSDILVPGLTFEGGGVADFGRIDFEARYRNAMRIGSLRM